MSENKDHKVKDRVAPYMKYTGLAFQLAGLIVIGILGGQWIDDKLGMEIPIVTILLTLLLFVGFMIKLYKELIKS